MQKKATLAREFFHQQRIDLRKALRSGSLDNVTYQKTLTPLKDKAKEVENLCYEYERKGLKKVFGDDDIYFNFNAIESLVKENKSENYGDVQNKHDD